MRSNASLAIALLLVGTSVLVVPTAAQSTNTDITVRASPFFPSSDETCAIIYARPAPADQPGLVQRRSIRLTATTGPYDKVVFSYALAPNPGTAVAPGLDRALKWDLGSSGAEGWNTAVNNQTSTTPGAVRQLIFEQGSLSANTPRDFRVAFIVPPNAVGDSPNPSMADNYPITVTAFNTRTGTSDTTADARSVCIKIDNTPPKIVKAITRDSTQDGHIDRMELEFSEAIDPDSVVKDEFSVKNTKYPDENAYALFPPLKPNLGTEKRVVLNIAPGIRYDTGDIPQLYYPASLERPDRPSTTSLTDLAGNKMAQIMPETIEEKDGAKPVLVSAFAPIEATDVLLTFSEPVYGGAGPRAEITVEDLQYRNAGGLNDCVKTPLDSQLDLLRHTPGPTTGHQVTIFLRDVNICEGDFDRTLEGWLLRDSQNPPSECDIDGPDTFEPSDAANTCNKAIHDERGLTALPAGTLPVKNTSPMVVASGGAEISIGTSQLALKFNGPVSGSGDLVPIDIKSLDIVSADGTGQGPGGILAVQHRPGSALAILSLDKPVRPTDVDDSPARVRIKCDMQGNSQIKGTAVNAFVPCFDPDGDGLADVPMVDQTPPSILQARTYDGDRDGYIDGYYLVLSEPIDDASFCAGPVPNMPAPRTCDPNQPAPTTPPANGARPDFGNSLTIEGIPGPYTWDTDLKPNDDQGIIRFKDGILTSYDMPAIRTNCVGPPADIPGKVCGAGLFADLAHLYPNAPLPYTTANKMKEICPSNSGPNACATFVNELDGAPPAIWEARTIDTPVFDDTQSATNKTEGNGWIDGYQITFSEPVKPLETFHKEEWSVAGHLVVDVRLFEKGEEYLRDVERLIEDDRLTIVFNETQTGFGDTALRPELTYKPILGGIKDHRGNAMRVLEPIDVNEKDGAPPTITAIEAPHALPDPTDPRKVYYTDAIGQPSKVTVRFSEPVDDGNLGSLIRANFVYANAFAPGNAADGSGVSGMTSQNAIVHKAGTDFAVITLNGALTQHDMDNDCLGANAGAIYEVAATVPVQQRQAAGVTCRPLDFAPDTQAPAAVSALLVTQGVTTANSVTLTWKAPGDDGNGHGAVSGYLIKVSKQEINQTNFDTSAVEGDVLATTAVVLGGTNANRIASGGLVFELSPDVNALAQPGMTQSLSITGLRADTQYYFAVKAFDSAQPAHVGPMSAVVTATTAQDFTPPSPAPVISSTSHAANKPTQANNAVFQWTESKDPEGAPNYCFALNADPSYTIDPKKDTTCVRQLSHTVTGLAKGKHVFHVAAVSGGGQTATAHYTIVVGAPVLDKQDIAAANGLLESTTRAERVEDVNTVKWTLPAETDLPPGATVSAVRVYRFQDGKGVLVGEVSGTYETLKTGSLVDNSTDAKADSLYRVEMVFADGQVQDQTITGYTRVVDVTPQPSKMLPALIVAAIALVALALAFVGIHMSRRGAAPTGPTTPAGIDVETGLPTHDVRCPSCQTPFQAVGNLPLQIGCPKCGVTGLLQ